jgi:hypothetical protein
MRGPNFDPVEYLSHRSCVMHASATDDVTRAFHSSILSGDRDEISVGFPDKHSLASCRDRIEFQSIFIISKARGAYPSDW